MNAEYMTFLSYMKQGLTSLDIKLEAPQYEKFYNFYRNLIETNKAVNLTAITELKEVVYKHFIDSLALVQVFPCLRRENYFVADMGTGAGFPGIPLAIAFPNIHFVLLDSLGKRISFINQVSKDLELENVETIHARAEDFARNVLYREKFDICVSRAVANLATLSEYCLPLVRMGGNFIPYKSGNIEEELELSLQAIKILGGVYKETIHFTLPFEEGERTLLKIDKKRKTSFKYPRKAGIPSKDPLK